MKQGFRGILAAMGLVLLLVPIGSAEASRGIPGTPKVMNIYLDWQISDQTVSELAKWDVVVLDANLQTSQPEKIRMLRQLNPKIKILAYVASEEISLARFAESQEYPMGRLASRIDAAWYLRDPSGKNVYFWPGAPMLNVTDQGRAGQNGQRWNEFLPQFISEDILATGLWDGIFLDNTFGELGSHVHTSVDVNADGRADAMKQIDAQWNAGMVKLLTRLRQLRPTMIFMGNGGTAYAKLLDGVFYEHFPSWNWTVNWKEFRQSVASNRPPPYTVLNVNTQNQYRPNDYRRMRFGFANAAIGDGYYSFDQGDAGHKQTWWYDEYEVNLGKPIGETRLLPSNKSQPVTPGVWIREYEQGLVLLNSLNGTQSVNLPGVFEKIRGTQDPRINDGSLVTSIQISAQDGLVLRRRLGALSLRGVPFPNGAFLRPISENGESVQQGSIVQTTDAPLGILVAHADVNQDGKEDLLQIQNGLISVQITGGRLVSFRPFSSFGGSLSLAVGNTNRDSALELIVAKQYEGLPEVRVFSWNGARLASWLAYQPAFSGGVRVAIGDVNGDGLREIVTVPASPGGPQVRIWKTDGKVWGGSFFAFDAFERGGASIAVGDLDADGQDDIVVGSGNGAMPRVRVLDGTGKMKRELRFGSSPLANGLRVTVADVNGDGKKEVLVGGLPVF